MDTPPYRRILATVAWKLPSFALISLRALCSAFVSVHEVIPKLRVQRLPRPVPFFFALVNNPPVAATGTTSRAQLPGDGAL